MANIPQKEAKKQYLQYLGKNLILLPKIFESIFTIPKYIESALNVLILIAQAGFNGQKLTLPKGKHPSYYKKVVIPFLAKLTVKHALPGTPVFKHIAYNEGQASISYEFSSYIKGEFGKMKTKELASGKIRKGEGYIIVNLDEFFKIRGLYAKQLYLSLCCWQQEQKLELYKTGDKNLFDLWQLPRSYKGIYSQIIKPAIAKIHAHTSFDIAKVNCHPDKITLIYNKVKNKIKDEAKVIIDKHPHLPMKVGGYRATLFYDRKFATKQANKQPTTTQPIYEYIANLVAAGITKEAAMRYAAKKYKTYLPSNRDPKAGMLINNQVVSKF